MDTAAVLLDDGRASERFVAVDVPEVIARFGHAHAVLLGDAEMVTGSAQVIETASVFAPDWFHRAVRSRQRGYVGGRHCASEALVRLGSSGARETLATGPFGAPQWPAGVAGSIAHSVQIAMAIVASRQQWRSIGIDCEPIIDASTAASVFQHIVPEQRDIVWRGASPHMPTFEETLTIGFAAKESIYKCLNPVVHEFFGFDAVRLETIDMARGTAHFVIVQPLGDEFQPDSRLCVRFSFGHGHVFAACALRAE